MRLLAFGTVALIILSLGSVSARPIDEERLSYFLSETPWRFGIEDETSAKWNDVLFRAARDNPSAQSALIAFANGIGVVSEAAEQFAELIIDSL